MKRVRAVGSIFLSALLILNLSIWAPKAFAEDMVSYFDTMFANNEYIIYTDQTVNNNSFYSIVSSMFNEGIQEYYNSSSDYSYLGMYGGSDAISCNYGGMTCSFKLYRHKPSSVELVKSYEDIRIIIDSNVESAFPMVKNNVFEINYDGSMFSSEQEKQNYINSYLNSFNESHGSDYTAFSYDAMCGVIQRKEYDGSRIIKRMAKTVDSVVFNYVEEPYSADFEKLTSGTLTVKTDADIDSELLNNYIWRKASGAYSFNLDGPIRNNKVYIKMSKWLDGHENVIEKHLVTIAQDSNIDIETFERFGFGEYIDIKANMPNNTYEYLSSFFNFAQFNMNGDGYNESISGTTGFNNGDLSHGVITYSKNYMNGQSTDVQIHRAPIRFVGYSDTTSDDYKNTVGDKLTIRADKLDLDTIRSILQNMNTGGYYIYPLGCDSQYTECDIALMDYETGTYEIHNVAIELDDSISNEFSSAVKINDDGTIDILKDSDITAWDESVYDYDDATGNSLQIYCNSNNSGKCSVHLTNYSKKISETHDFKYNMITSDRTSSYSALIKPEVALYPGENRDIFSFQNSILSRKNNHYPTARCNSNSSKCAVSIINSDKQIEIHKTNIAIKGGKSPEYLAAFPSDTLSLNVVDSGDNDIVYYASHAYFLSKTKTYSYLEEYNNSSAKIVYNGYEKHTVNVTLAPEKQEAKNEINQAINKIGFQKFNFTIDDLEYINLFYYKDPSLWGLGNYNSKTINDTFSKIVDNKHIGYFFFEQGGGGDRFMEEAGGGILLYYDGIAYDDANAAVTTQINHAIYVPDDTPEGKENYIKAAQERIDDYLGVNSGVTIDYVESLEDDYRTWLAPYFDLTGFDGNCYRITYKDKTEDVLILKNSSRMQTATFVASDVNSNITVTSDNANYPTNTVVSAENIDEKTAANKELLNKLGLKKAQIVNINLYSPTTGDIKDFDGVDFDVSVPIDGNKVEGDELYAYYISDNGKIEEHPITRDDFMGDFEVSHFSTYIISGKINDSVIQKANNPGTHDDISTWLIVCGISLLGLLSVFIVSFARKNAKKQ